MLTLYQVQTIISQCIMHNTTVHHQYQRTASLSQMGLTSPQHLHGFTSDVYLNRVFGLPYYHHTLPANALDQIDQQSTVGDMEDIVLTATLVVGGNIP